MLKCKHLACSCVINWMSLYLYSVLISYQVSTSWHQPLPVDSDCVLFLPWHLDEQLGQLWQSQLTRTLRPPLRLVGCGHIEKQPTPIPISHLFYWHHTHSRDQGSTGYTHSNSMLPSIIITSVKTYRQERVTSRAIAKTGFLDPISRWYVGSTISNNGYISK